jgi:hypothetical protein
MSHNFEFGLSQAAGEWIAVVGDDDGILPGGIKWVVKAAIEAGVKAVGSRTVSYTWPSVREDKKPSLEIPWSKKEVVADSKAAVKDVLQGRQDYRILPLLYTGGLIHKSLLTEMRANGGAIIRSQIPDVYSGFAISSIVDKFLFTENPWAVGGRSSHSTGLATLLNFKGKNEAFHSSDLIPFHKDIPLPDVGTFVFSLEALHYESYLQASFLHHNRLGITPEEQLELILAKCHPEYLGLLRNWVKNYCQVNGIVDFATGGTSKARYSRIRFLAIIDRIRYFCRYYRCFDDAKVAISNVYEAAGDARQLLDSRPSIVVSHARFARRIITRKLA